MEHDIDAFESAYRRLAGTRLSAAAPQDAPRDPERDEGPPKSTAKPRSRLLPRLALMAPRRRPTLFER